jgi:HupE/UreJ protein
MTTGRLGAMVAIALLLGTRAAWSHEVRPAYVELRELAPRTYDVFWKVPAVGGDRRLGLHLAFPEGCRNVTTPSATTTGSAYVERVRIACDGGLVGGEIRVEGLAATLTDVLARVAHADGSTQVARLTPDRTSFVVEAAPDAMEVVRTYLPLGIEHILTGVDHLLFVLGLLLLVDGFGRLVKTISAFTVAHGATLTLATLGVVRVPPAPVEAVIALSIVFVASEVVKRGRGAPSLAQRRPWLVAFTFGLLHGLGFAGGLSAAGLPAGHVPLALLFFSVGVEVGHFSFVAAVLTSLAVLARLRLDPPAWVRALPAYAIGSAATFWMIERVGRFWS